MSFNLEITFTGICGFVENSLATSPRVCVVMPSTEADRNAIDDEPLCPHESYIEQGFGFGRTRTPLKGQRLSFVIEESGASNPDIVLPFATNEKAGLLRIKDSGLSDVTTYPAVVSLVGVPPKPVTAQVLLDKGNILTVATGSWVLDPKGPALRAAHEVIVVLVELKSAIAYLDSFDGSTSTMVNLSPPTGISTVALRIVNTCARKTYGHKKALRDRDFKWYYEFLAKPADLGAKDDLPIPRYAADLIGGNNCFPGLLEPAQIKQPPPRS